MFSNKMEKSSKLFIRHLSNQVYLDSPLYYNALNFKAENLFYMVDPTYMFVFQIIT